MPLLLVAMAAGTGACFSRIYISRTPPNTPPVDSEPTAVVSEPLHDAEVSTNTGKTVVDPLTRFDRPIREGRYAEALQLCQAAESEKNGIPQELLFYREALCHEGLKKWKEAVSLYTTLAEGGDWTPRSIAAMFGLVRCAISQHHPDEALSVLAKLTLSSAHPAMQEKPYLGEVFFLRAALEATGGRPSVPHRWRKPVLSTFPSN